MPQTELEKAFSTLADAFNLTETEMAEEIKVIQQQIEELKGRIVELNGKQETLSHDRAAIEQIYNRYSDTGATQAAK
jgi:prefoldin subunit 5